MPKKIKIFDSKMKWESKRTIIISSPLFLRRTFPKSFLKKHTVVIMSFPLAVIGGFLLWFFMTFVKWRIMKSREQRFRKQSDQLHELLKKSSASTGKSPDDLLGEFYKKMGAEEDEKAKKSGQWKTIFEELEDRQRKDKGGKSKPSNKYSPEMFQDSLYKEGLESYQKLVKQQEEDDKIQEEAIKKKKSRNTKTKSFVNGNGLNPKYPKF